MLSEAGYAWFYPAGNPEGPPYWTPSRDAIDSAEASLANYVRSSSHPAGRDISSNLVNYGRQYLGITVEGRRILVVNAFCAPLSFPERQTELVVMQGGGECFFRASYDVARGRFVKLSVNAAR